MNESGGMPPTFVPHSLGLGGPPLGAPGGSQYPLGPMGGPPFAQQPMVTFKIIKIYFIFVKLNPSIKNLISLCRK